MGYSTVDERPTVLFVGQFRRYKGVPRLIEAIRQLRAEGLDIALKLIGSGPDSADLNRQIRMAGLADSATIEGGIDDETLHLRYATADCLVLPSLRAESFGIVLVEARAHGLPIVATDIRGVRELTQTLGGRIVPPHDVSALAGAIAQTIRELRVGTQRSRHSQVPEDFTWDRIAERYLNLYRALLRDRIANRRTVPTSAPEVCGLQSSAESPAATGAPRIGEPYAGTSVPTPAI
jgi:glycosyltransferase involved in cell wall biosynthesis